MISKEEALKEFTSSSGYYDKARIEKMYDAIVRSIGSCDQCKHSIKVEMMDNSEAYECTNIRELSWGEVGYKDVQKDWFCADFERKEPCGT